MANTPLFRIKRCCLNGRIVFTSKADGERVASGLSHDDVIEAVVNAPAIYKVLRSRSTARTVRTERLYVVVGLTHDAVIVYTKGALRRFAGEDHFYVFISTKRSVDDD
ncbi:MAG TPA: hypothetical protein VF316_12510 [Polyangiaceae bacterium]